MKFADMRPMLDAGVPRRSKVEFVQYLRTLEPKTRVGGPRGKGRLTAKRALELLGER